MTLVYSLNPNLQPQPKPRGADLFVALLQVPSFQTLLEETSKPKSTSDCKQARVKQVSIYHLDSPVCRDLVRTELVVKVVKLLEGLCEQNSTLVLRPYCRPHHRIHPWLPQSGGKICILLGAVASRGFTPSGPRKPCLCK